nr:unnamed protein product [Digitaria exilis]
MAGAPSLIHLRPSAVTNDLPCVLLSFHRTFLVIATAQPRHPPLQLRHHRRPTSPLAAPRRRAFSVSDSPRRGEELFPSPRGCSSAIFPPPGHPLRATKKPVKLLARRSSSCSENWQAPPLREIGERMGEEVTGDCMGGGKDTGVCVVGEEAGELPGWGKMPANCLGGGRGWRIAWAGEELEEDPAVATEEIGECEETEKGPSTRRQRRNRSARASPCGLASGQHLPSPIQ